MVGEMRLELIILFGNDILSVARIPIPPLALGGLN